MQIMIKRHFSSVLTYYSLLVTWRTNSFNIQQLYSLPTLYLCENKQRLVPLASYTDWFYNRDEKYLLGGTNWIFK